VSQGVAACCGLGGDWGGVGGRGQGWGEGGGGARRSGVGAAAWPGSPRRAVAAQRAAAACWAPLPEAPLVAERTMLPIPSRPASPPNPAATAASRMTRTRATRCAAPAGPRTHQRDAKTGHALTCTHAARRTDTHAHTLVPSSPAHPRLPRNPPLPPDRGLPRPGAARRVAVRFRELVLRLRRVQPDDGRSRFPKRHVPARAVGRRADGRAVRGGRGRVVDYRQGGALARRGLAGARGSGSGGPGSALGLERAASPPHRRVAHPLHPRASKSSSSPPAETTACGRPSRCSLGRCGC
jgi:hypothetical protein